MPSDAHDLLETLAACQPGLRGRIALRQAAAGDGSGDAAGGDVGSQLVCGTRRNADRVASLHDHWRQAHPEAGPLYWSARCWSHLVWQPVYLTVLAVHLGGRLPRLAHFAQSQQGGAVFGFSLPPQGLQAAPSADPSSLLPRAARQLRAWLTRQWREASAVFPLHAKVADRLAADYLMAALLLLQRHSPLGNDALQGLATRWLAAAGLAGCSSLVDVRLEDGRQCLALGRRVCCQHFRSTGASPCSSCPKLAPDTRMVLLRQELSNEC